jgi:rhamnosyltransferase
MPLQPSSSDTAPIAPSRGNICAIVVTYFPDAQFVARLDRIQQQVAQVIVIDNTDNPAPGIFPEVTGRSGIEVIRNGQNLGIGAALNQGLDRAMELGYGWAITFDQDSWVRPELVTTLLNIYAAQRDPEKIGVIGCNIQDENILESPNKFSSDSPIFVEIESVITSGSLLPLRTFSAAGPFRSDLFIDFVDCEYCLRLRKFGYKVLMSTAPLMTHALGAATRVSIGFGITNISFVRSNRPSLRRYYMTRNVIIVGKEYFATAPRWVLVSLIKVLIFAPLKIPFEQTARLKRFRATLRGAFDALRSKTGKAQDAWLRE